MRGMGVEIDGAMQQAPQPGRQAGSDIEAEAERGLTPAGRRGEMLGPVRDVADLPVVPELQVRHGVSLGGAPPMACASISRDHARNVESLKSSVSFGY
jgi:hypothetical protein